MLDNISVALVRLALREDLGTVGDVTTDALIPRDARGAAVLVAKEDCVLAGSEAFDLVFHEVASDTSVTWQARDGDDVARGTHIAHVEGYLRAILTAERTALNLIQRLSGVATITRRFIEAAPNVEIRDTRKTTPGMRILEKAAVKAGGGTNHRIGLYDAVLIKDNHIAVAGGIRAAIDRARSAQPGMKIQIECETLDQVRDAIAAGADEVLLDNMDPETLRRAAIACDCGVKTEASGGITLDSVAEIAKTGVDAISVGALTHSAPSIDFSLEVEVA